MCPNSVLLDQATTTLRKRIRKASVVTNLSSTLRHKDICTAPTGINTNSKKEIHAYSVCSRQISHTDLTMANSMMKWWGDILDCILCSLKICVLNGMAQWSRYVLYLMLIWVALILRSFDRERLRPINVGLARTAFAVTAWSTYGQCWSPRLMPSRTKGSGHRTRRNLDLYFGSTECI